MSHPALVPGAVAVVTGGASGIGLAAALRFARLGLKVVIADLGVERLEAAQAIIAALAPGGAADVMAADADVSSQDDLDRLEAEVTGRFGGVDVLMNNAGISPATSIFGDEEPWAKILATNLMGPIGGTRAFAPGMIARGRPGLVINTGSKQGITTPPGNPAYNMAKAALKTYTEALAHTLRTTPGCQVTAHLLIPGFVFTGLTQGHSFKPPGAWTPEQTADFMLQRLETGDFYILCPDNDVPRHLDERRIAWAASDIIENRPALSRWHPDHAAAFEAFVKG